MIAMQIRGRYRKRIVGWCGAPAFHRRVLFFSTSILVLGSMVVVGLFGSWGFLLFASILVVVEVLAFVCVWCLSQFGSVVIDEIPFVAPDKLKKFLRDGFDPELGWVRKPNTTKVDQGVRYHINAHASRLNPGHENFPLGVLTFGDSYVFCRECSDEETWQWYLSEKIGWNVFNFGVGNYGLDQALLRLRREYPLHPAPVLVMGMVPDTIVRILSMWRHYSEFGNVLGFKPRFDVCEDGLSLFPNLMNTPGKFCSIESVLPIVNSHDFFFQEKFIQHCFRFPYLISCMLQPRSLAVAGIKAIRNLCIQTGVDRTRLDELLIMIDRHDGANLRAKLYQNELSFALLTKLVEEFVAFGKAHGVTTILVILPMRDDIVYARRYGSYYWHWVRGIEGKVLTLDLMEYLGRDRQWDRFFKRWHYNALGNKFVAMMLAPMIQTALLKLNHSSKS